MQFSSHYYLQMNLPCLIEITRESIFHNLQHISLWPTELTPTCVLTNRNWFLNLIQILPSTLLPPSLRMALWGTLAVLDQCSVIGPHLWWRWMWNLLWNKKETPARYNCISWTGQVKPAGFAVRTGPKSKFGEPRKEPPPKPQTPKTTHAILSRLQDRGAWVWSQCWRGAKGKKRRLVSQELVIGGSFQSPCNGLYDASDNRVMRLAMKAMTRGKVISKTVQTLDKRFDVETQSDYRCQLSPVRGWMPLAGFEFRVPELPGYELELTAM